MVNFFDSNQMEYKDGILAQSRFDRCYCGTLYIFPFETFSISKPFIRKPGSRAHFGLQGIQWMGAYENPAYIFRNKQPYDRTGDCTYLPLAFSDLAAMRTSDGGVFYSEKDPHGINMFSCSDNSPDHEIAVIHPASDLEALSQDLGTILEHMGVPRLDVRAVQNEIFSRLGFDTARIKDDYPHIDQSEMFEEYVKKAGQPVSSIVEIMMDLHGKGFSSKEIGDIIFGSKQ